MTRRQFIYYSALAAGATALTGCATSRTAPLSANDKLNIGVVGIGGKGASDTDIVRARTSSRCATWTRTRWRNGKRRNIPKAKFYQDCRKMLEKEKSLDAVIVSTPDHMHAIGRRDRDADGQTRLLPEAADADGL